MMINSNKKEYIELLSMYGDIPSVVMDREKVNNFLFYDYIETEIVRYYAKSSSLILVNSEDEVFLQERAKTLDSPYKRDKTAGGHVSLGETFDQSMLRELYEEMGIKGIIAENQENFSNLLRTQNTKEEAILLPVARVNSLEVNIGGDKPYKRVFDTKIYTGIYNGNFEFNDGEVKNCIKICSSQIMDIIAEDPNKYTMSLPILLKICGDLSMIGQKN